MQTMTTKQYKAFLKGNKSKSKYNNVKTTVDGIKFDSKAEAKRYRYLKTMQRAGLISNLELQTSYNLQPGYKKNGKAIRAINYKADFQYLDSDGNTVIEDVKGSKDSVTAVFKIKKKLFEYKYPELTLTEVYIK